MGASRGGAKERRAGSRDHQRRRHRDGESAPVHISRFRCPWTSLRWGGEAHAGALSTRSGRRRSLPAACGLIAASAAGRGQTPRVGSPLRWPKPERSSRACAHRVNSLTATRPELATGASGREGLWAFALTLLWRWRSSRRPARRAPAKRPLSRARSSSPTRAFSRASPSIFRTRSRRRRARSSIPAASSSISGKSISRSIRPRGAFNCRAPTRSSKGFASARSNLASRASSSTSTAPPASYGSKAIRARRVLRPRDYRCC